MQVFSQDTQESQAKEEPQLGLLAPAHAPDFRQGLEGRAVGIQDIKGPHMARARAGLLLREVGQQGWTSALPHSHAPPLCHPPAHPHLSRCHSRSRWRRCLRDNKSAA